MLFFSIFGWGAALTFLGHFNKNTAIVKNWVHALHAFCFIICYKWMSAPDWINLSIMGSIGFYAFDTLHLLQQCYITGSIKKNAMFLIHHSIAIYGLFIAFSDSLKQAIILHVYYLLEYSNFLLYASYHIHKSYPENRNAILISECFQFVWYSYFRIIRFSLVYMHNFKIILSVDLCLQVGVILLFFMGVFWSWTLFKKCAKGLMINNDDVMQKNN
jgi:hypothetical protein